MSRKRTRVAYTVPAGGDHAVAHLVSRGGPFLYRRKPCEECPWRKDRPTGVFPAEAFRISANTAYDASMSTFACHMSGSELPATCAGFLLRNADNNIGVRFKLAHGDYDPDEVSSDVSLYRSYREMAEANGVAPDDPVLDACRENDE